MNPCLAADRLYEDLMNVLAFFYNSKTLPDGQISKIIKAGRLYEVLKTGKMN